MPDKVTFHPHSGLPVVRDPEGVPRVLAALSPREDFGGFMRYSAANAMIPRGQWKEIDLSPLPVPVLDQGSHGSCVGHGSTSAYWFSYLMAGGTVPPSGFSPTSLYALINGNRDGGAIVSDSMDALLNKGICTMAECPETVIYERQIPASAKETRKRFRASDCVHCDSFDAIGSALQLGFSVSFGILIRSGFNRPPADGVIPTGGGVLGGHCMNAYGCVKLGNGEWALMVRNSWGIKWSLQGNCILPEGHFGRGLDAFAIRSSQSDPMDPHPHPIAA